MANGRSWTGIGIGVGVAAVGGGLLWYLTRSGKASASPFTTAPPPPPRPSEQADGNLQPMGGPPLPPNKPGVLTLYMNGDVFALDGKRATPDQVVAALKAATTPIEATLYLVDKALWQSIIDRVGKAIDDKVKRVGVVSVGGLVHSNDARGRGEYR